MFSRKNYTFYNIFDFGSFNEKEYFEKESN
ncbi:MAG: hypothetical protein ACI9EK_003014 [Psychroserpens sp.]